MATDQLEQILTLQITAALAAAWSEAKQSADTSMLAAIERFPVKLSWSQQYKGYQVCFTAPRLAHLAHPRQVIYLTEAEQRAVPSILTRISRSFRLLVEQQPPLH